MEFEGTPRRALGRRAFLVGVLGATGAGLLAACGGGAATPTSAPKTDPKPAAGASPSPAASPAAAQPVASPGAAVASPSPSPSPSPAASPAAAAPPAVGSPPPVPNAAAARQYSGQRLTYYGDAVGLGAELDQRLAAQFAQDTGIQVNVVPRSQNATESYSAYQRFFQARSADVDVVMIDVIWPGAFAQHLVDLNQKLGSEAGNHYPGIVQNNTIDGKLVGMPWFADFGILYYRTDLLQKYGIAAPPTTWDELEEQARRVVEGERSGNPNLVGFVFQGNAYEGLTCDALEWLASSGGGTILEGDRVTLNNPQAIAILNKARGWVGTIAPRGVTSYQEEDARNVFQGGNAVFMRNWPYAYALGQRDDSPVKGKFEVAPLPAGQGQKSVGTVGGWQLGVSQYSRSQDAAIELVRYLTGVEVQTYRALVPGGSYVPTIASVAERPEVVRAQPYLQNLRDVERVARPSNVTGERYNEVSSAFFQGVNQILNGTDAAQAVPQIEQRIQRLVM
jgi:trehalose/maltose transport system substrate-binding protein